jgi:hypothetical protein
MHVYSGRVAVGFFGGLLSVFFPRKKGEKTEDI